MNRVDMDKNGTEKRYEPRSVTKLEDLKDLLSMHTDIVMNPFFGKKRGCCDLKADLTK